MSRQFKHLSFTNIKAESSGRIRKGICAVFGNVDSWGDRIHAGAFAKTITEGQSRVKHLWNHDYMQPPIASIKELRELTRDELPEEVLKKAPEAMGGLLVAREYYRNPFSDWILAAIDAGDINEMSFAFDTVKYSITEEDTGLDDMPKRRIRELTELKLFDTSDVNWGMNAATVAVGAKTGQIRPLGAIYSDLLLIQEELKAGRRNAESDQKLIDLIHATCVELGANCADQPTDEPKSEKAEAADNSTSLKSDWLRIVNLQLD